MCASWSREPLPWALRGLHEGITACLQHKALLAAVKGPGGGRDEEDTSLLSFRAHCARAGEAECHGPGLGQWVVDCLGIWRKEPPPAASCRPGTWRQRLSRLYCRLSLLALALKSIDYETVPINLIKDGGQQVRRLPLATMWELEALENPAGGAEASWQRRLLALPHGNGWQAVQQEEPWEGPRLQAPYHSRPLSA